MLQKAELSGLLIQRTPSEAPQRRYVLHRTGCSQEAERLDMVQTRTQGTRLSDHVRAAESGSHGPRSSVVFLNPSRSLGLRVAYELVMTFAVDRNDLD